MHTAWEPIQNEHLFKIIYTERMQIMINVSGNIW